MLAVLTGPVRSGKSSAGLALARATGLQLVVAVAGSEEDEEMRRRIQRHRNDRPAGTAVVDASLADWRSEVPEDACLLLDCLGSVIGGHLWRLVPDDAEVVGGDVERAAERHCDEIVAWVVAREAPSVVVTNEVGWGVVPPTPLGRLFRDVVGRANRALVEAADVAWLVVAGTCVDIKELNREVTWPSR
ncbi:MAG: bifunctional adenosylcobinamide kinase/adenosylcobinamide-phosphate guanylyltransferase [Coriobacteriia bacterium]